MAGMDFANIDWGTVAAQACGPGSVWNGTRCVLKAKTTNPVMDRALYGSNGAPPAPLVDGWAAAGAPAPPPLSARQKALQSQQRAEDWAAGQSQALADIAGTIRWEPTPDYETPEGIDVEALAAQGPSFTDQSLWGLDDSTMQAIQDALDARPFEDAGEVSPYNEDSEFRGQYSPEFDAANATSGLTDPAADMGAGETDEELLARFLDGLGGEDPAAPAGAIMDIYGGGDDAAYRAWQDETGIYERDADGNLIDHGGWSAWQLWDSAKRMGVTDPWANGQGDTGAGAGDGDGDGETPAFDATPDGVPTFVAAQVDELQIINDRLKSIKDAHKKLLDSGIEEIDGIEEVLTEAESKIYESQYGAKDPLTGEVLTPGEMDRLLSTFETRRTTSKKNRAADRAEILAIMTDEGVPAGLAQSELDMIQAIHGDSIDTQFDYIESMWRIGKLSHDERTSMIGNMIGSYKLQLRDTVVEMLMAEEINTADYVAAAEQDALRSGNMADMFENATEDEVYALMRSGMTDFLQLPADKEIGMIEAGEWAGYTQGQKSDVLLTAGYVRNADGTFTAPAADADAGLKVPIPLGTLSELGMTAEAAREAGYTLSNIQYDPAQPGRILDASVTGMGTASDYGTIAGEQRLAEASELAYTGLITEGEWAGYTEAQKTVALANNEDPTGMITEGKWRGFTYGQKAAALNAQGIDPETGEPYEDEDVEPEDKKYRMDASELTDRGLSLADFDVFGGGIPGSTSQVMISVKEFADLTGEYMFPAAPEADPDWMTDAFPSGVMEADVPGLPFTVVGGQYQMDVEALATFGPLQAAFDAKRNNAQQRNIKDIALELPITGIYQMIEQDVDVMRALKLPGSDKNWGETVEEETLWLLTIEQGARSDEGYAQIWANYTGNSVGVDRVWNEAQKAWFDRSPVVVVEPDSEYRR